MLWVQERKRGEKLEIAKDITLLKRFTKKEQRYEVLEEGLCGERLLFLQLERLLHLGIRKDPLD